MEKRKWSYGYRKRIKSAEREPRIRRKNERSKKECRDQRYIRRRCKEERKET
jgi:hypothetical protein